MKSIIAYSQVLRLNKICYNKSDLEKNCQKQLKILTNRGCNKTGTMTHINKAFGIHKNEILNNNPTKSDEKIPLIVTFNITLPNLRHIINKN